MTSTRIHCSYVRYDDVCLLIIFLVSSRTDGAGGFGFRNRIIICLSVLDVCLSLCIFPYTRITYNTCT